MRNVGVLVVSIILVMLSVLSVLSVFLGLCGCGCTSLGKNSSSSYSSPDSFITRRGYLTDYNTYVKADYVIGAFKDRNGDKDVGYGYVGGYDNFDMVRMINFLNSIPSNQYSNGDIISVDGLKYKKREEIILCGSGHSVWEPYANPPEPVLEEGEDRLVHQEEYFRWINSHPHLDFPPSPVR